MAPSQARPLMRKNNGGFTLIEVLLALAILSIALTAIIRATSQNIRDTLYVQNKTIAMWVGTQIVNEARVGVLKLPAAPDSLEQNTKMLSQTWPWEASMTGTANPKIKKIIVRVFTENNHAQLIELVSYVYAP